MELRKWSWWRLFLKLRPLLNVQHAGDELHRLREQLAQLQARLEKVEKERNEYRSQTEQLESKACHCVLKTSDILVQ